MSTRMIGGQNSLFGARTRAVAYRANLIVISTEGALLPTAVHILAALGTELLRAWSPATLATLPLGYRRMLFLMDRAIQLGQEVGENGVTARLAEL